MGDGRRSILDVDKMTSHDSVQHSSDYQVKLLLLGIRGTDLTRRSCLQVFCFCDIR